MKNKIIYPNNVIIFGTDRVELRNLAYMLHNCNQGHSISYIDIKQLKDVANFKESDRFILYTDTLKPTKSIINHFKSIGFTVLCVN